MQFGFALYLVTATCTSDCGRSGTFEGNLSSEARQAVLEKRIDVSNRSKLDRTAGKRAIQNRTGKATP
jgi:hypothetical protein